jgi:hypothetical protein
MPDHVHLFVRGSQVFRLGPWVGRLKQALAKAAGLCRGNRQLWEEGFFDHVLRNDESYSQKWNYVRENPVRAGLAKSVGGLALSRRDCLYRSRMICCSHGAASPCFRESNNQSASAHRGATTFMRRLLVSQLYPT